MSGHQDHGNPRKAHPDRLQKLDSVRARHADIAEDEVSPETAFQGFQGPGTVRCRGHRVSAVAEKIPGHLQDAVLVIYYQDFHALSLAST